MRKPDKKPEPITFGTAIKYGERTRVLWNEASPNERRGGLGLLVAVSLVILTLGLALAFFSGPGDISLTLDPVAEVALFTFAHVEHGPPMACMGCGPPEPIELVEVRLSLYEHDAISGLNSAVFNGSYREPLVIPYGETATVAIHLSGLSAYNGSKLHGDVWIAYFRGTGGVRHHLPPSWYPVDGTPTYFGRF